MKKFWSWSGPEVKTSGVRAETEAETEAGTEEIFGEDFRTDEGTRTLFLNGAIAPESWYDDDVTPEQFREELNAGSGEITVWINSPGGDCVAAAQIYNMLMDYPSAVTVKIDGLAASAASVIAMAGTRVLVSPVSMLMIHNPITLAFGDSADMRKTIEMLDEIKESIMNAYQIKTGLSRAKLSRLMDSETWMNAGKAVELGFADEIMRREDWGGGVIPDALPESAAFSRVEVMNSLMEKIACKCRIEQQRQPRGRSADTLLERLSLLRQW